MTIRRRIQQVFGTILILVLGSGLVYFWNARQVERGIETMGIDFEILSTAFMLRILMEEFVDYGEERPVIQWDKQYELLGKALEKKRSAPLKQAVTDDLWETYGRIGPLFRRLVDARKTEQAESHVSSQLQTALRQMLSNDLEKLAADADRLHRQTSESTASTQRIGLIVIVLLSSITAMIVALHLIMVNRKVLRRLAKLAASARLIGEGNFNHTITIERDDEIGQLSRAFNAMTEKLRGLYNSLEAEIRERKQKEAELVRSNQDLEQFAYIASHDLQEPLRNVSSAMQLLEKRYKGRLGDDADTFIRYAAESVVGMRELITDLLAYSRVSTRGLPFEKVKAEDVLTRSLRNLGALLRESAAEVTHDPLPEVRGDATQLSQVFQNLISNGVKFNKNKPPRIHVSASSVDGDWHFVVKDNGIGIEDRHRDKIFLIFQRLHKRQEYAGTGIGLAVSKKIVERHGGKIWVESLVGSGTSVYFTLPANQQERG